MTFQLERVEREGGVLTEGGAPVGVVQSMTLPEGMAPTSAEVIASLNEHLVITLQVWVLFYFHYRIERMIKLDTYVQPYVRSTNISLIDSHPMCFLSTWLE